MINHIRRLAARYAHINWALADQLIVSGVNFFTGILLARYLGIEEFGRFALAWMVVLFVNSIQYAMIVSPMMSIGPKQPEAETPAYFGAVVAQQICFSGVVFLLLFASVRLISDVFPEWRVEGLALPLAIAALAFQFQDFLRRYFFTRDRPSVAVASDAIRYMGQIAVLIWLFLTFGDTMDSAKVLWVIALMAAAAAVCGAFFMERIEINADKIRLTITHQWRFSKWLTASALMQWTSGNLYIIAAGALFGASAVGALNSAKNLMGVTHILVLGLENIVPVRSARHFHEGGKKAMYDYLKRITILSGGTTAAVAAIAAIAPDFWLGLVFGDDYRGYGYLLRWWAVIYVLFVFGLPLSSGLRAIEHTRTIFWAYLWMTIFTLLAAYPMVEFFSLSGALLGILVTHLIGLAVMTNGLKRMLA